MNLWLPRSESDVELNLGALVQKFTEKADSN